MFQTKVYYSDPNDYIPSNGLATSVNDCYRTHSLIYESNINNHGVIYRDNYNDIAIFENEINSFEDVLRFETMLRFVLLKDTLSVYEPSVRFTLFNNGVSGLSSYARIPDFKMDSANHVFQKSGAKNHLFPVEKIELENNVVLRSTVQNSDFIGLGLKDVSGKPHN